MNRIRIISLGISIFIHTSLLGVMSGSGWIGRWVPVLPVQKKSEIALEFVEVPEEIEEAKTKKKTKVISDKTVEAKDRVKEKPKDKKARTKEVSKGKQIAKRTLESPKVIPPQPIPSPEVDDKYGGVLGKEKSAPQVPMSKLPKVEYDIINIPEVSESIFSTSSEGPLTFETQAHKIGPYFKQVKRRIENYWLSYLVFKYQNTAPEESEAVVSFKILPTGEVNSVSVLEYSGDKLFRDFCVASITNTSPFQPLPENLEEEFKKEGGLDIVFTFRYR